MVSRVHIIDEAGVGGAIALMKMTGSDRTISVSDKM
jgi:hypothetical protein